MNDFTKDELEICKDGIEWMLYEGAMPHNKVEANEWRKVKDKIQSMINNYCEHENIGSSSEVNYVYFCRNCDKITGTF